MSTTTTNAAQYIRMSTEGQDLSPIVQRDAISKFATANGILIVRSYEDEGKSGLQLLNRPQLRQLLRDVSDGPPFTQILVYDVSRWGRFQDADAAAYYEYHCRLHGVQVVYVCESFSSDNAPMTALLKSMRRVMAAEYSRDIAAKSRAGQQRVVSMGFQMGKLPAFGYCRLSVSADGGRRVMLERGQRKAALTDRVVWALASPAELAMVRRVCDAYISGLALDTIAGLVSAEGWRDQRGGTVKARGLRALLGNEVLIGNFVWGRRSKGGKVLTCDPTRMNGSVPRIIDDATWAKVQKRLKEDADAEAVKRTRAAPPAKRGGAIAPRQLSLSLQRTDQTNAYRKLLGATRQLRDHPREFGRALCAALLKRGLPAMFDTRTMVLTFWDLRVRIRLMWPSEPTFWSMHRSRSVTHVSYVLIARMIALHQPLDFFVVPAHAVPPPLMGPLPTQVPGDLRQYWCWGPDQLVARLSTLSHGGSVKAVVSMTPTPALRGEMGTAS